MRNTENLVSALSDRTIALRALDGASVDMRIGRGRLWAELWDAGADTVDAVCQEIGVDLSAAKQERWVAGKLDAAPRDWLNWTATRALAGLTDDVREMILFNAARAGTETSEVVGRLIRQYHAARRAEANGEHPAGPDPVTVADRGAYILARLDGELAADFDGTTVTRVHRVVLAALTEWERAHADD